MIEPILLDGAALILPTNLEPFYCRLTFRFFSAARLSDKPLFARFGDTLIVSGLWILHLELPLGTGADPCRGDPVDEHSGI